MMRSKFEYLCVPLDCSTDLKLPYTIYDSEDYEVVLSRFTEKDLAKAFRLKFETGDQPGSYFALGLG